MTAATAELKNEHELKQLNRADLDAYAKEHGVDPAGHSNMKSLRDAVPSREETDDERQARGAGVDPAPASRDTSTAAGAEQVDESTPAPETVDEQRERQLKAGKATGAAKKVADAFKNATPAEQRAGKLGVHPVEGRVDNMTRRSDADVLTGHFCAIDYSKLSKDEIASVESIVGEGNAGVGKADYGVFIQPGTFDEDGYPLTAVVLLRDEHAAQIIVPYDALVPAGAGGRR